MVRKSPKKKSVLKKKSSLEEKNLRKLKFKVGGHGLYQAGLPVFPRNFARDSIISGILFQDSNMLKSQLIFCAKMQGKKRDPYTGEEKGKIFHEYPDSTVIRGKSTKYNACDTTALFLIGHEVYKRLSGDTGLSKKYKKNILLAVEYIKAHLSEGLFIEDPKFSGAEFYGFKVTYWKDSEIVKRKKGNPHFPITYLLAHVANMRGLKSAHYLLKDEKIESLISKMRAALNKKLVNKKTNDFYLAIDKKGPISAISSDSLHSLFYLSYDDIDVKVIKGISKNSKKLETFLGYRSLAKGLSKKVKDYYHSRTLWPFEQALINIGAKKFNLPRVEEVSSRIMKRLRTAPEVYEIINGKKRRGFRRYGCDPQLWTIAAKDYFRNQKKYKIIV